MSLVNPWTLLRSLVEQVEMSNAVDDHGHPLRNLQALRDARAAMDARDSTMNNDPLIRALMRELIWRTTMAHVNVKKRWWGRDDCWYRGCDKNEDPDEDHQFYSMELGPVTAKVETFDSDTYLTFTFDDVSVSTWLDSKRLYHNPSVNRKDFTAEQWVDWFQRAWNALDGLGLSTSAGE